MLLSFRSPISTLACAECGALEEILALNLQQLAVFTRHFEQPGPMHPTISSATDSRPYAAPPSTYPLAPVGALLPLPASVAPPSFPPSAPASIASSKKKSSRLELLRKIEDGDPTSPQATGERRVVSLRCHDSPCWLCCILLAVCLLMAIGLNWMPSI